MGVITHFIEKGLTMAKRTLPWCLINKGVPRECNTVTNGKPVIPVLYKYIGHVPTSATGGIIAWISNEGIGLAGQYSPQQLISLAALLIRHACDIESLPENFVLDRFYTCFQCLTNDRKWKVYDK